MAKENRIQTINIPTQSGNSAFVSQYSTEAINGSIGRIKSFSNFTGSIQIFESGNTTPMINVTTASGTNKFESFSFVNTTGSYYVNELLQIAISGASGTNAILGGLTIYYR